MLFKDFWKNSIVEDGYLIPFTDVALPVHGIHYMSLVDPFVQVLLQKVQTLLDKKAIEVVPQFQIHEGFT